MKQSEKLLFKALCSFKSKEFDETLLRSATPTVLGQLFFNRMQAIAFGTLNSHDLLGRVNREFRNSLRDSYTQSLEKNSSFYQGVGYLSDILNDCTCSYAMLKGAYLCRYYPEGYRTSNDIDLLVLPEDVTQIGNALSCAGFKQGSIMNGEFVPATRKEVIASKMTRGETVPYIKELALPGMRYLEVDVNFSLDYKNGDAPVLKDILSRAKRREIGGMEVQTLEESDFFIHLCSHLYKEATTLPWVEMMRDMTLYKYCDIYMLLADMTDEDVNRIFKRSEEMDMVKVCAFAIAQTAALFDVSNTYAVETARSFLRSEPEFLHRVVSPKDKKTFVYHEKDVLERFFAANRKDLLKEV